MRVNSHPESLQSSVLTSAESGRLSVVLVATRNPLNIGASARAISNFGFSDLRVVRPYDAAFRDARSAVGAAEVLRNAREYDTVAEAVADCALVVGTSAGSLQRDALHDIHRLEAGGSIMQHNLRAHRAAILFGSEKFGLSNEDLSHCHWLLRIPAREEHPSMNLGQSVALCLYELIRDDDSATPTQPVDSTPANAGQQELLTTVGLDVLEKTGYLDRHPRGNMQAELRRIVLRSNIGDKDAKAMLGMLRQALWKIDTLHS